MIAHSRPSLTAPKIDHNSHMTKVGVARLKAELRRYLDLAKHGRDVIITERGRPVARLTALPGTDKARSRRERLARAGVLTLGTGRLRPELRRPPRGPVAAGNGVLRALLEERAEGR
jgi:prevent-host-death family protein